MKRWLISGILLFIITTSLPFVPTVESTGESHSLAPNFTTVDQHNTSFSLYDNNTTVTILHFTGLESPVCIECEQEMIGQIQELASLRQLDKNITIITINIRKNPYSTNGLTIAEQNYDVNVSWHWVEEYSPYSVAGLYQKYWTIDGAFSNPTLLLLDKNHSIVGIYHVYCLGKGKIDDIQTALSLSQDANKIQAGTYEQFKNDGSSQEITFVAMFLLGILTAATPCSIALLVAMISYVGSLQKNQKEQSKKFSYQGLWIGIIFTLGMSLVFFVFGLIISSFGLVLETSAFFYLIAGIVLILLGINIFKPFRELLSFRSSRKTNPQFTGRGQTIFIKLSRRSLYLGAFFLGILFSIGWAPCALSLMMPVFILTLTQKISLLMSGLLLFVFGLGHGVPIIPLCAVTSSIRGKLGNKYVSAGKWLQMVFGVVIIGIGVIMAIRYWGINLW
jgi:cytochrome c-type biogenesis protein